MRVGFVPLNDCAPLAVAAETGLFRRFGVEVQLFRELGWATIRDKLAYGELDAAHAPCGLPLALAAGEGCVRTETITSLILNANGNAITLSERLWQAGVRDAVTLRAWFASGKARTPLTFGIVSPHSTHGWLLRRWLKAAGAEEGRDVRIVVVPPPQMPANLAAGNLDGFCVGEPWNSVAVERKDGWVVALSPDLAPGHPEKILAARADFAVLRSEEHLRLTAALREACAVCDQPGNRSQVVGILAGRRYVGLPEETLRRGFAEAFDRGHGLRADSPDLVSFERGGVNAPSAERAAWVVRCLGTPGAAPAAYGGAAFRPDIYDRACTLRSSISSHDSKLPHNVAGA